MPQVEGLVEDKICMLWWVHFKNPVETIKSHRGVDHRGRCLGLHSRQANPIDRISQYGKVLFFQRAVYQWLLADRGNPGRHHLNIARHIATDCEQQAQLIVC